MARTVRVTLVAGIIIIASVGGVFFSVDQVGMITAEVSVWGNANYSNASQCHLYMDGEIIATTQLYLQSDLYMYNENRYFNFEVEVKANRIHEFQVVTSEGERSTVRSAHVPFDDVTYLEISIMVPRTTVNIKGWYNGTISPNQIILQVDGRYQFETMVNQGEAFLFTEQLCRNQTHFFTVYTAPNMTNYTRSTEAFIGTTETTIWLNLP